jgi:hypothetical protein
MTELWRSRREQRRSREAEERFWRVRIGLEVVKAALWFVIRLFWDGGR